MGAVMATGTRPAARYPSGIGHFPPGRSWGVIEKCLYCEATNIKRLSKNQITCGKQKCKDARRKAILGER